MLVTSPFLSTANWVSVITGFYKYSYFLCGLHATNNRLCGVLINLLTGNKAPLSGGTSRGCKALECRVGFLRFIQEQYTGSFKVKIKMQVIPLSRKKVVRRIKN